MKKITIFLSISLFLILLFAYWPIGMGSTGIRPTTHGCLGVRLDSNIVHKFLPSARIEFGPFAYYVNKKTMGDWIKNYCFGKDIWWGE